jgi:hypothetical protein
VPFTLSHAAAALPFRRTRLITSAVVIGTFAPDFEYFLRLAPEDRYGHMMPGILVLTLPVAFLVFWAFEKFLKLPLFMLLPEGVQRKVQVDRTPFRIGGMRRFLLIVTSLLMGIATHIVWDSLTHFNTWFYQHIEPLRGSYVLPVLGRMAGYVVMQGVSSVLGLAIVAVWFWHWYRTTPSSAEALPKALLGMQKFAIASGIIAVAVVAGLLRAVIRAGLSTNPHQLRHFLVQAVATAMALAWWQLVAYGLFLQSSLNWQLSRNSEN